MTDADLIYNALLRAERRLEEQAANAADVSFKDHIAASFLALRTLREEIGNGLAKERR